MGLSHNTTATHQDHFKQFSYKKNRNNQKHSVQVNNGEGLVPDARLWLAKFHHPKPRLCGRSCTKRATIFLEEDLSVKQCFTITESR